MIWDQSKDSLIRQSPKLLDSNTKDLVLQVPTSIINTINLNKQSPNPNIAGQKVMTNQLLNGNKSPSFGQLATSTDEKVPQKMTIESIIPSSDYISHTKRNSALSNYQTTKSTLITPARTPIQRKSLFGTGQFQKNREYVPSSLDIFNNVESRMRPQSQVQMNQTMAEKLNKQFQDEMSNDSKINSKLSSNKIGSDPPLQPEFRLKNHLKRKSFLQDQSPPQKVKVQIHHSQTERKASDKVLQQLSTQDYLKFKGHVYQPPPKIIKGQIKLNQESQIDVKTQANHEIDNRLTTFRDLLDNEVTEINKQLIIRKDRNLLESSAIQSSQLSTKSSKSSHFYYDANKKQKMFATYRQFKPTDIQTVKTQIQARQVGAKSMMQTLRNQKEQLNYETHLPKLETHQKAQNMLEKVGQSLKTQTINNYQMEVSKTLNQVLKKIVADNEQLSSDGSDPQNKRDLSPTSLRKKKVLRKTIKVLKDLNPGNIKIIDELSYKVRKGLLSLHRLELLLQQLIHQKEIRDYENFCTQYAQEEQYVSNTDFKNRARYKFIDNPMKVTQLCDNLIYYKQKCIKNGTKEPELRRPIYLIKRKVPEGNLINLEDDVSLPIPVPKCNRNKVQIQKADKQICEFVRKVTMFLYNVFKDDERYIIDENEKERLGIEGNILFSKECSEHHHEVTARQRHQTALSQTHKFYTDLFDPRHNKVSKEKQAQVLLERIRNTDQKEFKLIKQNLNDLTNIEQMTNFEVLEKLNPLIFFLKDLNNDANQISEPSAKYISTNQINDLIQQDKMFKIGTQIIEEYTGIKLPEKYIQQEGAEGDGSVILHEGKQKSTNFYTQLKLASEYKSYQVSDVNQEYCRIINTNIPVDMNKYISNGKVHLKGDYLNETYIDGIAHLMRNLVIRQIVLEDCALKDKSVAAILKAGFEQTSLTTVKLFRVQIGELSVNQIENGLNQCSKLQTVHIIRPTILPEQASWLLYHLTVNPGVQDLKLQGFNFNSFICHQALLQLLEESKTILHLDISHSCMSIRQLMQVAEKLVRYGNNLQTLNIGYISLQIDQNKPEIVKWQEDFVKLMCDYLDPKPLSKKDPTVMVLQLTHLDLSGMHLRHFIKPLLKSIVKHSASNLSRLVCIHLNDNAFDEETKGYIYSKLGLNIHNFDQDQIPNNCKRLKYQFLKKFEDQTDEAQIVNNGILKDFKNEQEIEMFGIQSQGQENFVIERKIDREDMIFDEDPCSNVSFSQNNKLQKWSVKDECYVCHKHQFYQLYFNKNLPQFQKVPIGELANEFRDYEPGNPVLVSSINNWKPVRLIDLRVYCQMYKLNQNDPKLAKDMNKIKKHMPQPDWLKLEKEMIQGYTDEQLKKHKDTPNERIIEKLEKQVEEQQFQRITQTNNKLRQVAKLNTVEAIKLLEGRADSSVLYDEFTNSLPGMKMFSSYVQDLKDVQILNFDSDVINGQFMFCGYIKPGRHVVFIYESFEKQLYKQIIYVNPRENEIESTKVNEVQTNEPKLNVRVKDSLNSDIADQEQFVFKDWVYLTNEHIFRLFKHDFEGQQDLSLLPLMQQNYHLILKAYRLFVADSQSVQAAEDFLSNFELTRSSKIKNRGIKMDRQNFMKLVYKVNLKLGNTAIKFFKSLASFIENFESDREVQIITPDQKQYTNNINSLFFNNLNLIKDRFFNPNSVKNKIMTRELLDKLIIRAQIEILPEDLEYIINLLKQGPYLVEEQHNQGLTFHEFILIICSLGISQKTKGKQQIPQDKLFGFLKKLFEVYGIEDKLVKWTIPRRKTGNEMKSYLKFGDQDSEVEEEKPKEIVHIETKSPSKKK